jgi:Mrp family chromosome partitioning ATPase
MDPIKRAVERLRAGRSGDVLQGETSRAHGRLQPTVPVVGRPARADTETAELVLDKAHLEASRIVAYESINPCSKPFDMLRTQVLQSMDAKGWQLLAVTSPTPGCGKTFTAANLAFSIARQPERFAMLVDLDLQRPRVASCLGVDDARGLIDVLASHATLPEVIQPVAAGNSRLTVLPAGRPSLDSAAWMASRMMSGLLQDIRRDFRTRIVVIDLPPLLSSDDVITLLPHIDCVLLVVAAGITTQSEIEECSKHLHATDVVRIVFNKSTERDSGYHGAYY